MIPSSGLARTMRLPRFLIDTYTLSLEATPGHQWWQQRLKEEKNRYLIPLFIEGKTEGLAYGHTARSYPPSHTVGISQETCFTKHSRPEARKN